MKVFLLGQGRATAASIAALGQAPLFVAAGETYLVARYRQVLWETPIDCEGVLDVEGLLVEVL